MGFEITENTFVISDSHFGHKAVLEREPSRLKSAKAYGYNDFYKFHKDLWNKQVGKKDTLLHLGDLYYEGGFSYLKKLNGTKKLVIGNNDIERFEKLKNIKSWSVQKGLALQIPQSKEILAKLYAQFGKSMVKDDIYLNAIVLDCAGERIMFSHFPVFHRKAHDRFAKSRDTLDKLFALADCSLNIHGHIHSRNTQHSFCFNVSCEQLGFAPKRLGEILTLWRHKIHI
ncbi:metallophosphoesterase family protein [Helicobacter sp. MIT 21-1697]|uniref:metallophosphoesterase n=1 Tax=Helicobacter sp. MIT 21-1697 TaxID=2993733 RepID=UPI00224AB184|nr:metallophosphoesterase [Helicobacter sp. MIT 21-1697]MCX2716323.1 metallophosphoesterase family protein [Helicobacter sp. MIT 21-1697]